MLRKKGKTRSTDAGQQKNNPKEDETPWFVDDAWIAHQIAMQPGTIRVQRHKRKNQLPHWFPLDPVQIGSSPRYIRAEVEAWLKGEKS